MCISTIDGKGRLLASGYLELWLKPVALCWVFHQYSCHLSSSWHYRCHWHSCQWMLWAYLDCPVLALWQATWLLLNWIHAATTYPGASDFKPLCPMYSLNFLHHVAMYCSLMHVAPFSHIMCQSFPLLHGLHQSHALVPLVCILCPDYSLLQLHLLWCLCVFPTKGHCCLTQAFPYFLALAVMMASGAPPPA